MRRLFVPLLLIASMPLLAAAQAVDYSLTRPATPGGWVPPLRLAGAATERGMGLSLDAGRDWFARVGVGGSLESGTLLSLGGGYRWGNGESLALEVTRAKGQPQPGLALRYDWPRYYLRMAYDPKPGEVPQETLRFSAGIRF